jgi:hypothetical protein
MAKITGGNVGRRNLSGRRGNISGMRRGSI